MQLKKKFLRDKEYKDDYVKFMNDVIAKGYAEKALLIEAKSGKKVWLISYHGVYHPKKPPLDSSINTSPGFGECFV